MNPQMRIRRFLALLLLLISTPLFSATYTYTGNNFATASGSYTTSDSISGSFVTASTLPSSMALTDISGQITSFSFTDGVQTRTNVNSVVMFFRVATNALGNISDWEFSLWLAPLANVTGPTPGASFIDSYSTFLQEVGVVNGNCNTVTAGLCSAGNSIADDGSNFMVMTLGTWAAMPPPSPQQIPTMSVWGLGILAGLLGIIGFRRRMK